MAYTIEEVRGLLPKIGDRRHGGTVDYVHTKNLWYRVRMTDGLTETYKMPKDISNKPGPKPTLDYVPAYDPHIRPDGIKCKVLETGKSYNTYAECARDLGCSAEAVRTAAKRHKKCKKNKYTIIEL